ncbi:MAG: HD domain-containing protein [Bacteroidales bacterium]|nr:HD domain-containing protein [Bacteroidales bacterium]
MAESNVNTLEQLKELSKRNESLSESLAWLLHKYENINTHNEQYQALLKEFGMEDELRKAQKDVKRYKMASMLYIVIYGFQELANCPNAQEQLDKLDEIFFVIGDIASKYKLQKIPTIGDNILLAGGIKTENKTNPIDAAMAALDIMFRMRDLKDNSDFVWEVGIGIHTGPIIGRFVSNKTTPYTLSGNNVLTAARLGYSSKRGHVSVSPMTYELVKEFFSMEKSGEIPVKYSGTMDVYDLFSILPSLRSDDPEKPWNEKFDLNYSRMQFMDIQEYMLDMLEARLPQNLYYHNVKHTIDVTTEVELMGWAEGVPESDILLLKVAGLFHDSGHIIQYKGHEEKSCEFAQEILPKFNYPQEKIDKIKSIIMATQLPHTPTNILEAIIQDADLDYLGRSDFIPVSNNLYRELKERNMIGTIDQWNEMQIKFIEGHQYYTNTARSLREVNKQIQIERIKELLGKGELIDR